MMERFAWFEQRRAGLELARVLDEARGHEKYAGVRAVASRSGALELYARGQLAVDEALVEERPPLEGPAGIAGRVMSALDEDPRPASSARGWRRIAGAAAALTLAGVGLLVAASRYATPSPAQDDTALVALRGVVDDLRVRTERTIDSLGSTIDTTIVSVDQAVRTETQALTTDVRWAVGLIVDRIPVPGLRGNSS